VSDETTPGGAIPGGTAATGGASAEPDRPAPAAGGGSGTRANGLTYERARAELEDVVRRLEAGGTSLEESLTLWERGEDLARTCQELLEGARARLDAHRGRGAAPPTGVGSA
jgi:exodeoxyribonuclease VII small subunit